MHLKSVTLQNDRYPTNEHYPFNLPLFQQTREIDLAPITLFVGENGTGKSTLLEAMARRCGIHIWEGPPMHRVTHNPYEKSLAQYLRATWVAGSVPGGFFSAQTFHHFSVLLDELASADPGQLKAFGGQSLMTLSHGQSLMSYFAARYKIKGLYMLDEPETALTPARQVELVRIMREMAFDGQAQFVVATHSPVVMACPGAEVLSFDDAPVTPIDYRQTEHFKFYKTFMADPEGVLGG